MKSFVENDVVKLMQPAEADLMGRREGVTTVRAGEIGTIVCVHGDPEQPKAYIVEFSMDDVFTIALATVTPDMIEMYAN